MKASHVTLVVPQRARRRRRAAKLLRVEGQDAKAEGPCGRSFVKFYSLIIATHQQIHQTAVPVAAAADQMTIINHASVDCGAQVLEWNPEAKHVREILESDEDGYMLNDCSAKNKFITIELCDDIIINTIHFANLELFSSMITEIRLSISDR